MGGKSFHLTCAFRALPPASTASNVPRGTLAPPNVPRGTLAPPNVPRGTLAPPNVPRGTLARPNPSSLSFQASQERELPKLASRELRSLTHPARRIRISK